MYEVLLAEDDRAQRYVYSKMKSWKEYGFSICEQAENGTRALELLREHPVDVVFTDIRMPFVTGIELMKTIKKEQPDILFVLVSSYDEFEYAREGLRLGAVDYMVKPITEEDLSKVLKRVQKMLSEKTKDNSADLFEKIAPGVNWEDPLLKNMSQYVLKNIEQNLSLEEVAAALNLSKDYFGKQIKGKTGMNFRNLYNSFKMEYAKPLIKDGQLKIYEISEKLGYSSADYFTQIFKNSTKMTPAEYKRS